MLFFFKYLAFVINSAGGLYSLFAQNPDWFTVHILLPVGISFYTFQSMSYTIDIYRGVTKPERNFGLFALYVSFFPQLVAGPIERSTSLLPQLKANHSFDYQEVADGLKLMAWGFFKKLVIADRLAVYVDAVFAEPSKYHGVTLVVGSVLFYYQLYCDFSGYSDIAVGAAQTMGIKLNRNFTRPFLAKTMAEKWRRWHISLGEWFRDYLYMPLKSVPILRNNPSILIVLTWLLIGLWHGANWTFVTWGLLSGLYLVVSYKTKKIRIALVDKFRLDSIRFIYNAFKILTTFLLSAFTIIFFRSPTMGDAFTYFYGMTTSFNLSLSAVIPVEFGRYNLLMAFIFVVAMEIVQSYQEYLWQAKGIRLRAALLELPTGLRLFIYALLLLSIVMFGVFEANEYIYFQF